MTAIRFNQIIDIVDTLPKHNTKVYGTRSIQRINEIIVHHSASPSFSPTQAALYHVRNHDWPGIGYHFYITSDGVVYQTNNIESISYHCRGQNSNTIGICLDGNFMTMEPTKGQLRSLERLFILLMLRLPIVRINPHSLYVPTDCCGTFLKFQLSDYFTKKLT